MISPVKPEVTASTNATTGTEAAFQAVVDSIVKRFDELGIAYCLLRNRDEIPSGLGKWADIDFLVSADTDPEGLYAAFADLQPAQMVPYRDRAIAFFFPVLDRFLRVDMFYGDPDYRSMPFATNAEIMAGRWLDRGYMVAPLLYQAYVTGISKLLWNGAFPARYAPMFGDVARTQPAALHRLLATAFGDSLADELLRLAQRGELLQAPGLSGRCRKALLITSVRRRPVATLRGIAKQSAIAIQERTHPTGLDVVLLGPDGSGKSSVCQTIASMEHRRIPFLIADYIVLYHRVLPPLTTVASRVSGRDVRPKSSPGRPQESPLHRPLVWFTKYLYYTTDQWISEVTWMRHRLSHATLLLRDRHLMELVIDSRRYRFAGPAIFPRIIAHLVPRPDLVIFLDAPAEVVHRRKQELSLAELARQRERYRELVGRLPHGRIVNGNQPFEQVVNDVLGVIAEETQARTRQRYGMAADAPHNAASSEAQAAPWPTS